ncbi:MAG: sn-glycerol-3-phosphate ABC transporter ATP-binding protein UgpC [Actinomycetota bacterium]
MAGITFDGVSKVFDDGTLAVDALHLDIADGEFLVLVGPSGCGKTTSLRMAAGLEDPTGGEIRIGDRVVNDVPSRSRDIAMVFQNYALYPHMSVLDNLAFGLRMRGVGKAERYVAARRAAEVLGITDLLDRQPKQLSGGQRQRVAMGRAIVREPQAFLMDEPLSNLDAKLRVQMRAEIARIQRTLGVTTLYVTHDQVEAMTMADRVAVMRKGVLQQVAPPAEVYDRPANLFVAGFIGSPPMNLFAAHIVAGDAGHIVEFGSSRLALADRPGLAELVGREVVLGIRPEDLEDTAFDPGAPPDRRLVATVDLVEQLGSDVLVRTVIDAVPATGEQVIDAAEGTQVGVAAGAPLVARCNPRSRPVRGGTIELSVDTERIHLFDPATGLAIR